MISKDGKKNGEFPIYCDKENVIVFLLVKNSNDMSKYASLPTSVVIAVIFSKNSLLASN